MDFTPVNLFLLVITLSCISASPDFEYKLQSDATKLAQKGLCNQLLNAEDPITKLILKIIYEIQSHMHDGIPSMGIPPLDPLKIPLYDFEMKESQYKFKGEITDALVKNLSTFNVTKISTEELKSRVNISIEIPNLEINGNYNLNGKVLSFIPIFGKGPFTLKPVDTTCSTFAEVWIKSGHLVLTSFDFKVNIRSVKAQFDGIMGGGVVSNVINKLLNNFGLSLFYRLEPMVHEEIREMLIADINRILKEIPIENLMMQALDPTPIVCA